MLEIVIWAGAILTVLGLAGLVWCILIVMKAKRAGLSEEEMDAWETEFAGLSDHPSDD